MTPAYEDTRDAILRFVTRYTDYHNAPPTQREIARACYLAQSTVRYHLSVLQAQGRLDYRRGKARGLAVREAQS